MPTVNCDSCGARVKVPETKLGGPDKCPACKGNLFVRIELPADEPSVPAVVFETVAEPIPDVPKTPVIPIVSESKSAQMRLEALCRIEILVKGGVDHLANIENMVRLFYNLLVIQLVLTGGAVIVWFLWASLKAWGRVG